MQLTMGLGYQRPASPAEGRPGQAPAEHGGGPSGLWQRGHRGHCSLTGQAQTLPTPPGPREWKRVSLPCCVLAPGHTLLAVLRLPLPPATEHPAVQCVGVSTLSSHRAGARAQENDQGGAPERLWGSDSKSSTAEETTELCSEEGARNWLPEGHVSPAQLGKGSPRSAGLTAAPGRLLPGRAARSCTSGGGRAGLC